MSVFVRLNQGGAVTWKSSVASATDLPTIGNQDGDVRAVVDTNTLYIWSAGSWHSTGGGGGGGSPGGASGTIQFNSSGTFGGDTQLTWDNSGKVLGLNGLAIHALSGSMSLVDNQSSAINIPGLSWSAAAYEFNIIEFSITRNGSKAVGTFHICNDSVSASISPQGTSLTDLGIVFSASVSAGTVNIKYTTSSTGFNAFMKYAIRQWI